MEHNNKQRIPYWKWVPTAFALSGIIVLIFATYGPPASSSGFVSTLKGFFEWVAPEYAAAKAHYKAIPGPGSWLFAFVLGMAIGGFIAGRTSKEIPVRDIPPIWKQRFGDSRAKRYAATFLGGGLFISGSTQLAISGLYFGVVIFAVAMLTARLIFGKIAQKEEIQ
jgi:hypothetical protein